MKLKYHLIWSKVSSYLPTFFFFFFPFTKKKGTVLERGWQFLGNVSVADKKRKGLKAIATKLYQCFGVKENILSKNRNTFFFLFGNCLFTLMRRLNDPLLWKVTLHNLVTGLLTFGGHIDIYWRHNKYTLHFIKNCIALEIADREADSVWFGYGYDNCNMAHCGF